MLNTLHNALEMRLEKGHSYAGKSDSTPRFDEVDTTVNWCIIPNMKAKLEHHSKVTDEYGNVIAALLRDFQADVMAFKRRVYES